MLRPRIILADLDLNYLVPIHYKLADNFFDKIDLETICDREYFEKLFSSPQKIDVLIVSDELFDPILLRHDIGKIYIMTEEDGVSNKRSSNLEYIYKYSSIREIYSQIISGYFIAGDEQVQKDKTKVVLVTSASGGVGKTTLALGIGSCLASKSGKSIMYINVDYMQTFQRFLDDQSPISDNVVYSAASDASKVSFADIKHTLRNETFSFLPPFKMPLTSLGINISIFKNIISTAKAANEFDYIVVDTTSTFDENNAMLFGLADRVVIVTNQTRGSVFATNLFISNINDIDKDKYIFVCNNYETESKPSSACKSKYVINEYVEHFAKYDEMLPSDFAKSSGIRRVALLLM